MSLPKVDLASSCASKPGINDFHTLESISNKPNCLFNLNKGNLARVKTISFAAIRWRQRVGIFDGQRLIACFTKRHYRAQAALNFLARKREYQGLQLKIHTPHFGQQMNYHSTIDACDDVLQSGLVLWMRNTYAEKLAAWRTEKGLSTFDSANFELESSELEEFLP